MSAAFSAFRNQYRPQLEWCVVGLTLIGFLAIKLSLLTVRYGDGNTYLYMAQQWLAGTWPYRDFFLADFPVQLYFLMGFVKIFGTWLQGYYALPVILESLTALVLYLVAKKESPKLASIAPIAYLFCFTTFATVDYPTGLQFVTLFLVCGWWCYQHKRYVALGSLLALAAMVKLYVAPGIIGLLLFLFITRQYKSAAKVMLGGVGMSALLLLPIVSVFWQHGIQSTILHQLNRPDGIQKTMLYQFYFYHEWLLLTVAGVGAYFSWKKSPLPWMLLSWGLFFLFFQDLYYLYFHVMTWALILVSLAGIPKLLAWRLPPDYNYLQPMLLSVAVTAVIAWLGFGWYVYKGIYLENQWTNYQEIAAYLQTEAPPGFLYGSHELVPLLAHQSGRPIFQNIIETNPQGFGSGVNSKEKISQDVAEQGALFIARISDYPEYGIEAQGFEAYFDREVFDESCQLLRSFPDTGGGQTNYVSVYHCQK